MRYRGLPESSWFQPKPIILLLGNYSSGKSSFVNKFLNKEIQQTGQAPTDDSFTVLVPGPAFELQEGSAVCRREDLPFAHLKRHGQAFLSHFFLKAIPELEDTIIIDTPGMLDAKTQNDRGYQYSEVVGDLAELADLILVCFDPHKAGTVYELHRHLKEVLPKATYENRLVFILNRIDECQNLSDLLRVYGSLCWNLSQMTGRKDIPPIYLTAFDPKQQPSFLNDISGQEEEVFTKVAASHHHRQEHILSMIERHAHKLLMIYRMLRAFHFKKILNIVASLALGAAAGAGLFAYFYFYDPRSWAMAASIVLALLVGVSVYMLKAAFLRRGLPYFYEKWATGRNQLDQELVREILDKDFDKVSKFAGWRLYSGEIRGLKRVWKRAARGQ